MYGIYASVLVLVCILDDQIVVPKTIAASLSEQVDGTRGRTLNSGKLSCP